jgi:uncharacterized Zn-finger protein
MASPIPHFHNESGAPAIEIGVHEFKCVGARAPFDHPHIFIDMGDEDEAVCGYCATLYRYNPALGRFETLPPGHLLAEPA